MKIKGVVLGVAGAFAVTGAQAADLPAAAAPEPVDYVRVCDAFGAGFFYVPGTETCLKISGYVRAEYDAGITQSSGSHWGNQLNYGDKDSNGYRFRARGDARFDVRTNTEFGLLRSYIEIYLQNDTGTPNGENTGAALDKGYIQFGGLTAGQAQSFYDFFTGFGYNSIYEPAHSDTSTNLLAYTYTFGNGFSLTGSLEDSSSRNTSVTDPITGKDIYGGNRYPDIVGAFQIAQGWGSAQLSAAGHAVAVNSAWQNAVSNGLANGNTSDTYGYAVQLGTIINLPFLGQGDQFALQGAFAQGATKYVSPQAYVTYGNSFDTYSEGLPDAYVNPLSGSLELVTSWSVSAGLNHYFTPQISAALEGSYLGANVDLPNASGTVVNNFNGTLTVNYTPVENMNIGAALEYVNVAPSNDGTSGLKASNSLIGLVRLQRNF
ncbi:porin [Pseudoxanthobacter sp.]|uniref:porin n=1 Tax=Pseudoxanthobacter sp. TaxID=1925742 RepID=UPI002FDFA542